MRVDATIVRACCAALLGVAVGAAGCRDRAEEPQPAAGDAPAAADGEAQADAGDARLVLLRLHDANEHFVELGRLAAERGTSDELRALGERIRADHAVNDRALLRLAEAQGVPLASRVVGHRRNGMTGSVGQRTEPGSPILEPGVTRGTMSGNAPGGGTGMGGSVSPEQPDPRVVREPGSAASRTRGPSESYAWSLEVIDMANAREWLSRIEGKRFDRQFLVRALVDHRRLVDAVQRTPISPTADATLRRHVDRTIAMLERHTEALEALLESDSATERRNIRGTE